MKMLFLLLLLLIVALCYATWISIQMYALFIVGSALLVFAVIYGVGKVVSKTETGQKVGDTIREGMKWCFNTPTRSVLSIFFLIALAIVSIISYDAFQPQSSDIEVEYYNWQVEDSFMDISYDEDKYGCLVTNNGDKAAYVKIKVTQYNGNDNIVKEEELGSILSSGQSQLLEFSAAEDAQEVSYDIVEVSKPKYTVLEIGYTKDSLVYFCYDEENKLTVLNNTDDSIKACGAQIVYFNEDNKIIGERSAAMRDLGAYEQEESHFSPDYIPEDYDHYEIYEWAYSE